MGLSNVYGPANDEESKEVLRHAIKIGCVSLEFALEYVRTSLINEIDILGHVGCACNCFRYV